MGELIEVMVLYLKHRKRLLPLFIIVLLILFAFFIGLYTPQEKAERLNDAGLETELNNNIESDSVSGPVAVEVKPKKGKDERAFHVEARSSDPKKEGEESSVSLFKNFLIDQLKIEGINEETSLKILDHIRSQLGKETPYNLSDSIRAIMPDLNDQDVSYLTEMVSHAATEASEKGEK